VAAAASPSDATGYENTDCRPLPLVPFWEQPLNQWDGMFTAGVRAHLTASRLAVPLMLPQRRGLIVSTTANLGALPYLRNLFYDLAKNAIAPSRASTGSRTSTGGNRRPSASPGRHSARSCRGFSVTVQFSPRLAIAAGLTLPIIETIRRWNQIEEIRAWPFRAGGHRACRDAEG
jgi:NAD(P)-dependent dehydrogenase (short-subunit alcohol dehydrogenase family)